ncbi:MAG: glycosyltransferase family 39 protein [Bacteroidales bacterium]|nr:glycosyltransferase family 39 protein [Bacteroidales bacterium]
MPINNQFSAITTQVFLAISKRKTLAFIGLVLVYLLLAGTFWQLFEMPQGIHFIRQTDSLAFLSNYYHFGAGFFEPQVFNLSSVEGKAANEFPIIYYFISLIYSVFGEHEFLLRAANLLISFTGFIALFKLIFLIIKDLFYTYFFTFLLLSSTVVMYYANNFLPDPASLSFSILGWYLFLLVIFKRKSSLLLLLSFLFFTLASLIKITYFIHPVSALFALIISRYILKNKLGEARRIEIASLAFGVSLLLVLSWWFAFVKNYNSTYGDHYFLTTIRPIWSLSKHQISEVWHAVSNVWYGNYLYRNSYYPIALLLLFGLPFALFKKSFLNYIVWFLLAGSASLFVVFYAQFKDHDYYFLNYFIPFMFLLLHAFIAVKDKFPGFVNAIYLKIFLILFLAFSLFDTSVMVKKRYVESRDAFSEIGFVLQGFDQKLDSLLLPQDAKFIIYPDETRNGGLYAIKRKGWNIGRHDTSFISQISTYKDGGADYLLTTKRVDFLSYDKVYEGEGVTIFKVGK